MPNPTTNYQIKVMLIQAEGPRTSVVMESFLWGITPSKEGALQMMDLLKAQAPAIKKDSTATFDDTG